MIKALRKLGKINKYLKSYIDKYFILGKIEVKEM